MTWVEVILLIAGLIASIVCGILKKYKAMLIAIIYSTVIFILLVVTLILGWGFN